MIPKSLSRQISKKFNTSSTKSLCWPVLITLTLNLLDCLNLIITGANFIASGLVPKTKVIKGG